MAKYIISIDCEYPGVPSAFDETGSIMCCTDRAHRQIINEKAGFP